MSQLRDALAAARDGHPGTTQSAVADTELPPTTVPTFVAPAGGAQVRGSVQLSVTSTAPLVQFLLDGSPFGAPVAVTGGQAGTAWTTWGYDGTHTWAAVDCSAGGTCATDQASIQLNITPGAPVLTAPLGGALTSGAFTMTATADGGTVKFLIDGIVRGTDATAPYALVVPDSLSDGTHTAGAVICAVGGNPCSTVDKTLVTFSAKSLHPKLSPLVPAAISPNGDGVADGTTAKLRLASKQKASWSLVRSNGTTAAGPFSLGTLAAGKHTFELPGKARRVPDGTYSLVVRTADATKGSHLVGATATPIRIDTTAPKLSGAAGAGTTFYPVKDGYRDRFTPSGNVAEKAKLTLEVSPDKHTVVRTMTKRSAGAGHYGFSWDGRDADRALVPAGPYFYRVVAVDAVGNTARSRWSRVNASPKKLVKRTKTLTLTGAEASFYGGDPSCSGGSTSSSSYPHGLLLLNTCDLYYDDFQLAVAFYDFHLPAAISYDRLTFAASGDTVYTPTTLTSAVYDQTSQQWHFFDPADILEPGTGTHRLGTVSANRFLNGRTVETAVSIDNAYGVGPWDFDIQDVRLTVQYRTLG